MNWVDLLIVFLVLLFAIQGVGRSFIAEASDFIFFLAAFAVSLKFYNIGAAVLENSLNINHSFSSVIGFFLVWAVVEILLSLLAGLVISTKDLTVLDQRLKNFSFMPALFRGIITVAIILVLVATFPIQPNLKTAVDSSLLGSEILARAYGLERPIKNVFDGFTESSLTFLTIEPKTNESINLGFRTANLKSRPDLESRMIDLVNNERSSRGIQALRSDPALLSIAREHSADMFERGYFSYYSPEGKSVADRADAAGISYQVIGENLAYAPSLERAQSGLMSSPGHRANILSSDYQRIGIGIMDGGVYGLMITQVFTN